MLALRIIPVLVLGLGFIYLGLLFIEGNPEPVIISLGRFSTPELRLGFVVMTCLTIGVIIGALLAGVQLALLVFQNRALRKNLNKQNKSLPVSEALTSEAPTPLDLP